MNHHVMCIEYKQEWPGATVPMVALFDGRDLTEAEARALIREDAPSNKLVTMGKDQYMTVFRSLKEQPMAHGEAGEPEQHIASIVYDKHAGEYTFTTDQAVTLAGSEAVSVTVTALDAGSDGNVGANTIVIVDTPIDGLATITNPSPAFGGLDEEDDDSLRDRIVEYEQNQGVSYVGSTADYRRWALEVAGVGSVQVQGGQNGDCTVKLILTGSDGSPASEEVCQDVYDHIMRPDDESQRLAGVNDLLTVTPATKVTVQVSATIELDGTALLADIKEEFRLRLSQYYASAEGAETGEVRYTKVGATLLECAGVSDYDHATLKINSGTDNITIDAGEIPVTESGDITLTDGAEG